MLLGQWLGSLACTMAGRAVEGVGAGTLEEGSRALVLHDLAGCICRRRRTAPGRQEAQQQMMAAAWAAANMTRCYCTAVEIQVNCLKTILDDVFVCRACCVIAVCGLLVLVWLLRPGNL